MSFWLICLPREDIERCVSIGTIGLGRPQGISKVRQGDGVVCLITKEKPWKVLAIGSATSDYYVDEKPVFRKQGTFIDRFDFTAETLNPEPSFAELIDRLNFLRKKESWPAYFKSGIVRLTDADWRVFMDHSKVSV